MSKAELTESEQLTVDSYEQIAEEWAQEHLTCGFWSKDFDLFRKYLPAGKVLEVGSGGGRDARELIELGYDYTGTDISPALITQARRNVPSGKFFAASVYDLDFPENLFDGFWASAVLLHIPKTRIDEALSRVHLVTRNKGIGFISLKQGSGEKIIEEETTGGQKYKRLFAFYEHDEFIEVLNHNNYKVLESAIGPVTSKTTWLTFILEVNKE